MAKDKSIPSNIVLAKEKFKYDTIQDMVNDIALKVGMVVDINGYYKPDDGATHKRVIADSDDGSGVQLNNGLWANIIFEDIFNILWLGADNKNKTNNNKCFSKFFDLMRKNPFKEFVIPEGNYYVHHHYYLPSNITLTINGNIIVDGIDSVQTGFYIFSQDGEKEFPLYSGTHDSIIRGKGSIDHRGNEFENNAASIRMYHCKNIEIQGLTFKNSKNFHFIELGGVDGAILKDLKFKGQFYSAELSELSMECIQLESASPGCGPGVYPLDYTANKNILIENCYFGKGDNGAGIYSCIGSHDNVNDITTRNIIVRNCVFEEIDSSGLKNKKMIGHIDKTDNFIIENNRFINCNSTICFGLNLHKNIQMKNNVFENHKELPCILLENIDNVLINNNTIKNASGTGIQLKMNSNINNFVLKNSYFSNLGEYAIENESTNVNFILKNNIIENACMNNISSEITYPVFLGSENRKLVSITDNSIFSDNEFSTAPIRFTTEGTKMIETLNCRNNNFMFKNINIPNYAFLLAKEYDILFNQEVYFGKYNFNHDIRVYDRLEIIFSYIGGEKNKTILLKHGGVLGTEIQNRIVIQDTNLSDTSSAFVMNELTINLTNLTFDIVNNINLTDTKIFSTKKDNTEDNKFLKIIEIRGYYNSNKVYYR